MGRPQGTIEVETSVINLKYEQYRLKSSSREKVLLSSILTGGITEPLVGVVPPSAVPVLLDGFKRLRCAIKLQLTSVPFLSIADHEAVGILELLRISNKSALSLLEQAKLVSDLKSVFGLSIREIGERLDRSSAWVCVRLNAIEEMSAVVRQAIFADKFPAYSFLYTLRQFRRLNGVPSSDVDEFVKAVCGKKLSHRDIELLASGFFRGGESMRKEITSGNLSFCLEKMKVTERPQGLSDLEARVLRDLEIFQSAMGRLILKLKNPSLKTPAFFAQAGLLVSGILRNVERFVTTIRGFHDRCGHP